MDYDVFFSICQTPVDGFMPSEAQMLRHFFDQVHAADRLGAGCAWMAESHLSCQTQKLNPGAVIPQFEGEIAVNVDFLQLATRVFAETDRIHCGSAIMNILSNGGPIAAAERIRAFLLMHGLRAGEMRTLEVGFAAGRFPFIYAPYGIAPRNAVEAVAWHATITETFEEATEIFLRLLKGEELSSDMLSPRILTREDVRTDDDWDRVLRAHGRTTDLIPLAPRWTFPTVKIIPQDPTLDLLRLTIGSHYPATQVFANSILPCGVFNLSITPGAEIEATHQRMLTHYHPDGGAWSRRLMPRTVLVFINEDPGCTREAKIRRANAQAEKAIANYWLAVEGTLDPLKIEKATTNALVGDTEAIRQQIAERFHPEDRLMLWFDFNNHDSEQVIRSMEAFFEGVGPAVRSR